MESKRTGSFDAAQDLNTAPVQLRARGWRTRLSGLRVRLIGPYLILTLVLSLTGMFIVTRLVTSSVRERFVNQLLEASRAFADSLVLQEQVQLDGLRLMTFTQGVPDAMRARDREGLQTLLYPVAVNQGFDLVTATDDSGTELISLIREPGEQQYSSAQGSDLSQFELITSTLQQASDGIGDKYAGITETAYGYYLVTSAPVMLDQDITGVLMVGSRVEEILADIKRLILADLVLLNQDGEVIQTTLPGVVEELSALRLTREEASLPDPLGIRQFNFHARDYQIHYAPMIVRSSRVGTLGVVLPSNFIVATESTSRNLFSLLFSLGTMGIIILGYLTSRRISRPIMRIKDVSLAVAAGDLDQRTGVSGYDEVGQMGMAFDIMTSRLSKRTGQVIELYNDALERSEALHQATTRLQQTQQQLVQSEKLASVGQLTAGIVHDVKTPLAVIRGLAEEAQEETDPAFIHDSLTTIRKHAIRANTIVTDLLKFARQSNPEKQHQDICETVRTAVRLTDFLARKSNVEIEIAAEPGRIYTAFDAQLMEQVFINLIQNAIQAMPNGGKLDIFVRESDSLVGVAFRDTGVGIPKSDQQRIFDPFFTTKPPGEGTGLGLSVSYGIVAEHQGSISVESEVGKGSLFIIRLPKTSLNGQSPSASDWTEGAGSGSWS
jgi:signal transduction histidine kinase